MAQLKFSNTQIAYVLKQIEALQELKGCPISTFSLRGYAEGVLNICHPGFTRDRNKRGMDEDPVFTGEEYLEMDISEVTLKHGKLGVIKPVEWVISEVRAEAEWFPPLVVLRRKFAQYFEPADGKWPPPARQFGGSDE